MFQVKIFDYYRQNLEAEINKWLKENQGIQLVDIKYQIDEGDFAMIIYIFWGFLMKIYGDFWLDKTK